MVAFNCLRILGLAMGLGSVAWLQYESQKPWFFLNLEWYCKLSDNTKVKKEVNKS